MGLSSIYRTFVLSSFLALAIVGCKKEETEVGPPLPPSISIDMDGLSAFTTKKKSTSVNDDSTNYKKACNIVHAWDSISQKMIWVPKTILLEALHGKTPVYNNADSSWTWTYIKDVTGDGSYQASLNAIESKDSISWVLYVSRINGDGMFNFKWIEGNTDKKQTGGWWRLTDPILNKPFIIINWKKETETTRWIKYTNILECDCSQGSYIKYSTSSDIKYNASFDILLTSHNISSRIEWNSTTYAGRIIYKGWVYGWDSSLKSLAPEQSN